MTSDPITLALSRAEREEPGAAEELWNLVYADLRRIAAARVAKLAPGQTLQATALVNEVWMRLDGKGHHGWKSRRHFFAAAATSMRNILVDQARRKQALRRDGGREGAFEPDLVPCADADVDALDVLALDEALTALALDFERPARIAQLRFFAGLTIAEIAELEELDPRTVDRDLLFARTWLRRRL